MSVYDRWFELTPHVLASGKTMRLWLRKEFYNGSVSEIDGVVHAQWMTSGGADAVMAHAYPASVEAAMLIVETEVPTGHRR